MVDALMVDRPVTIEVVPDDVLLFLFFQVGDLTASIYSAINL